MDLIRSLSRIRKRVDKCCCTILNKVSLDIGSINNTIILAGSGRSGTTWLAEMLLSTCKMRYMFEPFNREYVNEVVNFNRRQFLDNDSAEVYGIVIEKILRGKIKNPWIDKFNTCLVARKRLIKEIRANLFLHYIRNKYTTIPIIFIIRNPFSVVKSRLENKWESHYNEILNQERLLNGLLCPFKRLLEKQHTLFEEHFLVWCIENYVPLKLLDADEYHMVTFERLVSEPKSEMERLQNYLNANFDWSRLNFKKPSAVSHHRKINYERVIMSWKKYFNKSDYDRGINILKELKLYHIYRVISERQLLDSSQLLESIN